MHVFFDLDGTLTDPKTGITTCIRHALNLLEFPVPSMQVLEQCIGPPLHDSFVEILGSKTLADKAVELYRERFGRIGLYENAVFDGIYESLVELNASVQSMYVVTSKPTIYAQRIVEHFGLNAFFSKVYGSNLDGTLTDKTELIRFVLEQESRRPDEVIMVGDSMESDILSAEKAGITGILIDRRDKREYDKKILLLDELPSKIKELEKHG